jgi:hypothetical protein
MSKLNSEPYVIFIIGRITPCMYYFFSIVEQNGQNVICTHPSATSPHSTDDTAIVIGFNPPGSCTSQTNVPPLLGRAEATR